MRLETEGLKTESDVEQKFLFPFLTLPAPVGLGLPPEEVLTKGTIKRVPIDKGAKHRLFVPDYVVSVAGLPLLVIEAKAPTESVDLGLDEARLYGNELNAQFPTGCNPCFRVISCNGAVLASSPLDAGQPDVRIDLQGFSAASVEVGRLVDACSRKALRARANSVWQGLRDATKAQFVRPVSLIGGRTVQNEELPQNSFGATIAAEYGHVFNPLTKDERAFVVKHAYVPSLRRDRYVDPIDRIVRAAVLPLGSEVKSVEDTGNPKEIIAALRKRSHREKQVLLLVGGVGVGKSTFVDYLSVVALPDDLRGHLVWLRVDLIKAPLSKDLAYQWLANTVLEELKKSRPNTDFDLRATLEKVFAPELKKFRKGAGDVLKPDSDAYRSMLAAKLNELQSDALLFAKAMTRYLGAEHSRLIIITLDNCDKRTRDEQLLMFDIAQWLQDEFSCMVVLPMRDVTYDAHKHEPPLDTLIKDLVFRIEPPQFIEVLQARVKLALQEMTEQKKLSATLSYELPNGMRVSYASDEQAVYLANILKALFEHDRFVKQVMAGLAGGDVRLALQIFLEFCKSGHIHTDEFFKARIDSQHLLPISLLARVLLRMNRRYYDGEKSYLKNLVQCEPNDPFPDHLVRLAILRWLEQGKGKGTPALRGFHPARDLFVDLVHAGHDLARVREEVAYLIRNRCIVPEHLRTETLDDGDLVTIGPSGLVHLQLLANPEYLAACAEDVFLSDEPMAKRIKERIDHGDTKGHFSRLTTTRNAKDLVSYLKTQVEQRLAWPKQFLDSDAVAGLHSLREAEAAIEALERDVSKRLWVGGLPWSSTQKDVRALFERNGVPVTGVVMPAGEDGKQNRGYAFVDVADTSAANRALDLDGQLRLNGRDLRIDQATPSVPELPLVAPTDRVHVSNLVFDASQEDLRSLVAHLGVTVGDVVVIMDQVTRRSRGYGFVTVGSVEEARSVITALDGKEYRGRRLHVHSATPRNPKR